MFLMIIVNDNGVNDYNDGNNEGTNKDNDEIIIMEKIKEGEMLMARMADMIVKIKLNQLISWFVFVITKTKNLISRLKVVFEIITTKDKYW